MLFCLIRPDSWKICRIFEMWGFVFFSRLLYQQQSMWMATCWLSQTTCLYTTIPNTGGGLAALTPQKVRPLLIWKMVGTHLHVLFFYLQCFFILFFFLFFFLFHHTLCWDTTTFTFTSFLLSSIKAPIKKSPLVFLSPCQLEHGHFWICFWLLSLFNTYSFAVTTNFSSFPILFLFFFFFYFISVLFCLQLFLAL